jgi:hypothetical protein
MSSAATITFEPDTVGVPTKEWQSFCQEHCIKHSPQTIGGNVYYAGEVEVHYTRHDLHFSTFWMGSAIPDVARLAMLAWRRWGGQLTADPEIRKTIVRADPEGKTTSATPTAADMSAASTRDL